MLNRELNAREKEILLMIRPTTFQDIVDIVRREVENSRYNARRELRLLKNNGNNGENKNNGNNGCSNTDIDIRGN